MNDSLMSLFEIIITVAITFLIIWMNTKYFKEKFWKALIHGHQKRCGSQQAMCALNSNIIFATKAAEQQNLPKCLF